MTIANATIMLLDEFKPTEDLKVHRIAEQLMDENRWE